MSKRKIHMLNPVTGIPLCNIKIKNAISTVTYSESTCKLCLNHKFNNLPFDEKDEASLIALILNIASHHWDDMNCRTIISYCSTDFIKKEYEKFSIKCYTSSYKKAIENELMDRLLLESKWD
jgi:hypothetical protein